MDKFRFWLIVLFLRFGGMTLVSGKGLPLFARTPDLAGITGKIISNCYSERVKEIGLAGTFSDSFFTTVTSGIYPFSTVLLNDDTNDRSPQNGEVPLMMRYKLQLFAVAVTSSSELKETLVRISNSRWWNHMAKFYIFDSGNKVRCSEAFEVLWTAWKMHILAAKFICNDDKKGPLIYMFNPYTNNAGDDWKLERIYDGVNNHPWALFVRKCHANVNICQNVDFDQTRNPGGYEFRVTSGTNYILPNHTSTGQYSKAKYSNYLLHMISRHMKVTLQFVLHEENTTLGFVDHNGKGHGMIQDLIEGRSDIFFYVVPVTSFPELPGSSCVSVQFYAMTQYTGYPSQWEKFISAIDRPSRIGLYIVILANFIFFKYAFRQSFMIAFLNTIRIICNSCLVKLPGKMGLRIYLACLFLFFIVIQALYQGELAARLTNHERYPNINNERDLLESSYFIYVSERYASVFNAIAYKDRFVQLENADSCLNYALHNSSIACVNRKELLMNPAIEHKLHVSKNPIAQFQMKFPIGKNLPLEEKLNRLLLNYMKSGIPDYIVETCFTDEMHTLDVNENGIDDGSFKVIMLRDLDFAFFIIPFGLTCATIVFLIELYVARNRPSRKRKRVRLAWH
ncbi:uncharacterized protein [Venturia canescens]|uniref:uncharacterized protein n=1 Tax=Venturia canescens TaxID=32260 RepID=UPI001C9D45CC|nr:uncharacterized protein LOC122417344 [Venturia canescens]